MDLVGSETLYNKYAALSGILPDRPYRRISRRVVPLARLPHAVESDYHKPALGRLALQTLELAATNDKVVVERRQRCLYLLCIVLQRSGVGYFGFSDHVAGCCIGLLTSDRYAT